MNGPQSTAPKIPAPPPPSTNRRLDVDYDTYFSTSRGSVYYPTLTSPHKPPEPPTKRASQPQFNSATTPRATPQTPVGGSSISVSSRINQFNNSSTGNNQPLRPSAPTVPNALAPTIASNAPLRPSVPLPPLNGTSTSPRSSFQPPPITTTSTSTITTPHHNSSNRPSIQVSTFSHYSTTPAPTRPVAPSIPLAPQAPAAPHVPTIPLPQQPTIPLPKAPTDGGQRDSILHSKHQSNTSSTTTSGTSSTGTTIIHPNIDNGFAYWSHRQKSGQGFNSNPPPPVMKAPIAPIPPIIPSVPKPPNRLDLTQLPPTQKLTQQSPPPPQQPLPGSLGSSHHSYNSKLVNLDSPYDTITTNTNTSSPPFSSSSKNPQTPLSQPIPSHLRKAESIHKSPFGFASSDQSVVSTRDTKTLQAILIDSLNEPLSFDLPPSISGEDSSQEDDLDEQLHASYTPRSTFENNGPVSFFSSSSTTPRNGLQVIHNNSSVETRPLDNNAFGRLQHSLPPPTPPTQPPLPTTPLTSAPKSSIPTPRTPNQSFTSFMNTPDVGPNKGLNNISSSNNNHFSLSSSSPQANTTSTSTTGNQPPVPSRPSQQPGFPTMMRLQTLTLTSKDISLGQRQYITNPPYVQESPQPPQQLSPRQAISSPVGPHSPTNRTYSHNKNGEISFSTSRPFTLPKNNNNPPPPPPPPPSNNLDKSTGPRQLLTATTTQPNQYGTVVHHPSASNPPGRLSMLPQPEASDDEGTMVEENNDTLSPIPQRRREGAMGNIRDNNARQSGLLPNSTSFSHFDPDWDIQSVASSTNNNNNNNNNNDPFHNPGLGSTQPSVQWSPEDMEQQAKNENEYGHYHPMEINNKLMDEKVIKLWRLSYAESRQRQNENWEYFEDQCITLNIPITEALKNSKPGQMLVLDGIPIRQRAPIWAQLLSIDQLKRQFPTFYEDCCLQLTQKPTKDSKDITKDVKRTMQHHELFRSNDGIEMLTNILSVFSFKYPKIGYCQSMNLIASTLMLFFNEVDSYYMLDVFINKLLPPCYYTDNLIDVKTDCQVICHYIRKRMPQLHQKIVSLDVDLVSICLPWMMCIFVEILPLETTMRIWDIIIAEGNHTVLFRVGLCIFDHAKDQIMQCKSSMDFLVLLGSLPSQLLDCDTLIAMAHRPLCYLAKWQIDKNRKRYKKQIEREYLKSLKYLNQQQLKNNGGK